ncbi:MAG TPA: DUF4438 domain-containing protein [Candidatus Omnitrophota bacterium]|nr:DUF4438 domain-containing protein [Candidatus Omnitrophota bacterium]
MLKTNEAKLVKMAVQGKPANPIRYAEFEVDAEGRGHSLPSVGGITYNVKCGDPAFGWRGDHIEPGVSVLIDEEKRTSRQNMALQFLACIGNEATVITGAAKGAKGTVVGHHGGVEHLIVDFDDRTLDRLTYDDKILVKAHGQGLQIEDSSDTVVYNLDPRVLKRWGVRSLKGGALEVPVVLSVPSAIMGSGLGHPDPGTGDYDITTQDPKTVKRLGLDRIRFGDFVAILDADNTFGRHYYEGAVTIGIVTHSDSFLSGHGPGVCTLLSSKSGKIRVRHDADANLAKILKIGRFKR